MNGLIIGAESPSGIRLADVQMGAGTVGQNRFAASFAGELPSPWTAALTVRTPGGHTQTFQADPETVPSQGDSRLDVPYRLVAEEGVHEVVLTLADKTGNLLYRSPPGRVDLSGLLDAYVERNYYTEEASARVVCLAPMLDSDTLQNTVLEVAVRDTDVRHTAGPPLTSRTAVDLPLKGVPPGDYTVSLQLRDKDGRKQASQELSLRKLPAGPGSEVKIVRRDKGAHLLVDGKPYLMLGTDLHGYPGDLVELVREVADAGFSMLCLTGASYYKGQEGLDEVERVLDAGLKHGVYIVIAPEMMYRGTIGSRYRLHRDLPLLVEKHPEPSPDDPDKIKTIRRLVVEMKTNMRRFMKHPALLMWRGLDEARAVTDVLMRRITHEIDPYHPSERVFGPGGISERADDIDVYNVHRYLHTDAPMSTPFDCARKTKLIADADRKPLHAFPGSLTSGCLRGMTYPEIRCQLYLGLIGGWRGIVWFRGRHLYLECWESVKRAMHQVSQLTPVLLEEDVPQDVTVTQPDDNPVYWSLHRHKGKRWVMAANARKREVTATFSLPGLKDRTSVKVWFEDRKLQSDGHAVTDTFGEYGVHVYEVSE